MQCKKGNCTIGETIVDYGCTRAEMKCADNMKFKIISNLQYGTHGLRKCLLQCEYDGGNFPEKNRERFEKVFYGKGKVKSLNLPSFFPIDSYRCIIF